MLIAMYMEGFPQWSEVDPDVQPIAGSETQMIRLARALRARGHWVDLFDQWADINAIENRYDVLIVKRQADCVHLAAQKKHRGRPIFGRVVFWTGDDTNQPFLEGMRDPKRLHDFKKSVSVILAISEYQKRRFIELGFPIEQIVRTRYGLPMEFFWRCNKSSRPFISGAPKQCIFTSVPFKGLAEVPRLWREVLKKVPDAKLKCFSNMQIHGHNKSANSPYTRIFEELRSIGVEVPGAATQTQIYDELCQSRCLFYPNTFPETFCLSALEARLAGAVPVTTDAGALPEVCGLGSMLVPMSPQYSEIFVDRTVRLLTDDQFWIRQTILNQHGRKAYRIESIAEEWEYWLQQDLRSDPFRWR